ncbi:MAG: hypothetical protein ACRC7O_17880, partial [Fimbriiglobus sp.]
MKASPPPPPPAPELPPPVAPPDSPPQAVPEAPDETRPWYGPADVLIAVLAVATVFLATSFPARNSDVWLNLASGRLIATGAYPFGGDPFSWTGADRPWANRSWLFDLAAYAVFSADPTGAALVALKAAFVAAGFALLLLLRKPGQPLWPWAGLAVVGVLAVLPHMLLRPCTASFFFLCVTFVLIGRGKWTGWRTPGLIAGLVAVWANVDVWCVLGPLAVLAVLIGEVVGESSGDSDAGPFRAGPPIPGLVRALLLSVAACLLNPMVLAALAKNPGEAAVQLVPTELGVAFPAAAAADPELTLLTMSPLSNEYLNAEQFGANPNGYAFWLLFVGGGVVLGASSSRVRAGHVAVWVAFAGVALVQYRLIPFFVAAALPLAAAHLNALSAGFPTAGTQAGRILAVFGGVGRLLTLTATLLLGLAAWPGWLQYVPVDTANANRVEWAVLPNPGTVRAAALVQSWRADGRLPAEATGLCSTPEFGNYCAWFAPAEKAFLNSRFVFHRTELSDLVELRRALAPNMNADGSMPPWGLAKDVSDRRGAAYLVIGGPRRVSLMPVFGLREGAAWDLWHLDGRTAVLGKPGLPYAAALEFDPVRLAFGPAQEPTPEAVPTPPPLADRPFLERYLARPAPLPPAADDAALYSDFADAIGQVISKQWQDSTGVRNQMRAAVSGVAVAALVPQDPLPPDGIRTALPVLIVKAARRATAAAPDRPDPFPPLVRAYNAPLIPTDDGEERRIQILTGMARFFARVPDPADCTPLLAMDVFRQATELTVIYETSNQLDLARATFRRAGGYAKRVAATAPNLIAGMLPPNIKSENPAAEVLQRMDAEEERITKRLARQTDVFDQQVAAVPSAAGRFQLAIDLGLPLKAIELFKDPAANDFGRDALAVAVRLIEVELRAGMLEQAALDLAELDRQTQALANKDGGDSAVKAQIRAMQAAIDRVAGNY